MIDVRKECGPIVYVFGCLIVAVLLLLCGVCHAEKIPKGKFVDAIIGESESGSYKGKLWIACVIRNRGSLQGVYGVNSPRVKQRLYSSRTFVEAVRAYEESASGDVTGGCKFWFSDNDLKMAKVQRIIRIEKLVKVARISGNNFYKKGK